MNRAALLKTVLFSVIAVSLLSCGDGRVISRKKMSKIYAEMFLADQWINENPQARRTADTTYVYEAIFEKYGCDADDYRKSVGHYMKDPDRFARILRKSSSIIETHIEELKHEKRMLVSETKSILIEFDFDRVLVLGANGLPRMTGRDSLKYFKDSSDVLIFDPFYGFGEEKESIVPLMLPEQDSLAVADSLAAADSVSVADSLMTADSLARADSLTVTDSSGIAQPLKQGHPDVRPVVKVPAGAGKH